MSVHLLRDGQRDLLDGEREGDAHDGPDRSAVAGDVRGGVEFDVEAADDDRADLRDPPDGARRDAGLVRSGTP